MIGRGQLHDDELGGSRSPMVVGINNTTKDRIIGPTMNEGRVGVSIEYITHNSTYPYGVYS